LYGTAQFFIGKLQKDCLDFVKTSRWPMRVAGLQQMVRLVYILPRNPCGAFRTVLFSESCLRRRLGKRNERINPLAKSERIAATAQIGM
jgi:hypothetical protein